MKPTMNCIGMRSNKRGSVHSSASAGHKNPLNLLDFTGLDLFGCPPPKGSEQLMSGMNLKCPELLGNEQERIRSSYTVVLITFVFIIKKGWTCRTLWRYVLQ
jgi:hypothetical protein